MADEMQLSGAANEPGDVASKGFRLAWLDYVRGINILTVVFVHVWRGVVSAGITPPNAGVSLFLDTIASMALFFFVSGMFISKSVDLPFASYLKLKAKDFVYPFVIWVTLHAILHSTAGGSVNIEHKLSDLWRAIYDPPWHYWFLYNLFFVQMLYFGIRRLKIPPAWFLAASVIFFLSGDIAGLSIGPWGVLYQVRRYMLWFALGTLIDRGGPIRWLSAAPTALLATIVILGAGTAAWAVSMGARDGYASLLPFTLLSASASLSLAILLERGNLLRFIAALGRRSLEVYLAHVIFLAMARIALQRVLGIESLPVHLVIGMLAGLYLPIGLYWASKRVGFPYLFSLKAR